jgi:hypothetical protein
MPGTLETLTALAAFPTYRAVSNEALIRCAAMRITEAASPAKSRVYPRAADVKSFSWRIQVSERTPPGVSTV